jgi:hypothetical protein
MPETPQIAEDAPETAEIVSVDIDAQKAENLPQEVPSEASLELNALWNVAEKVAKTEFVPDKLRGKRDKVFATILQGRALGIDPMTALREIWISPQGSPELGAELQAALVRKAGHRITGESTGTEATITGLRGDTGEEMTVTFTLEDAESQGLVKIKDGKPYARSSNNYPLPWERHTESMLWHRAVTKLVKRLFPDVLVGDVL